MNLRAAVSVIALGAGLALNAFSEQAKPPQTEAKNNPSPTGLEYRLGAEDVIEFKVYKEPELTTTAVVRPDGKISLPLAGDVQATGKTATELQAEITPKLREFIEDPVVSVVVKEINSPKISVSGEVRKSDVFPIKQRMTVLEAIALAGGETPFSKHRAIVLRILPSGQPQRIRVNLERLIKEGDPVYLQAGDTVYVE